MIEYKHAVTSDLAEIETLLTYYDLPASDCFLHLENFVVAFADGMLVGVGGFESCGNYGLVRSFAVSPEFKGHGIAKSLFQMVYDLALEQGKESLYLLTTTASDYFKKLGFSECVRSNCPEPITCTKQFSELCPGSAITMLLAL
ncbi:arsenic resistance N-acetyltransferase ArsN2 [uncultured Desulfuromonas sp.]|uniref:arsenic resistance N-acetyltransferase ArsN2 n=1 Tax=uncultured Desulfuromonas sp. TaxID=181013 RepID=UPI002AAB9C8E|nr:arsenic resistance N-acetyltransferase ArsN2 [uncultured Desulfuromonas sp.]